MDNDLHVFVADYLKSVRDELHEKYEFRTDYEITTENKMKKILKNIKE